MYFQIWLLTYTNVKTNTHRSICSQFVLIYFFSHSNPQQLAWTHLKDLRIIKRCVQYANEKETSHKLQILSTHSPLITNKCVEHTSELLSEWRNSHPRGANTRHRLKLPIFRNDTVYICIHLQLPKFLETRTEIRVLLSAYTRQGENMLFETVTDLKVRIPNTSQTAVITYMYGIR
jgi:hypothetical protein